jgi:hypothetical protein
MFRTWCVFNIHVYWVFVAKNRRHVFNAREIDDLRAIFADVCSDAQATLVEMDGDATVSTRVSSSRPDSPTNRRTKRVTHRVNCDLQNVRSSVVNPT